MKKGDQLYFDGGSMYRGYIAEMQQNAMAGLSSEYSKKLHAKDWFAVESAERILKELKCRIHAMLL